MFFHNFTTDKLNHLKKILLFLVLTVAFLLCGCGSQKKSFEIPTEKGSRDCTPVCLVPEATGETCFSDTSYLIDISNVSQGYLMASYTGSCEKVKFQITGPDQTTYTYNLTDELNTFPLSSHNGTYTVGIYENIQGKQYATLMSESFDVILENEFGAYLYPNQYVNFTENNEAISLGKQLAYSANTDLDVVSNVYNYLICNVTYDEAKAESVQSGYLPLIDETLQTGTGICLDYAAVMTSILRSQRIPTHLEVGYAGTVYHAWISTYIEDVGWVNGIIQFDGTDWELMDPTFGASTGSKKLKKFIGDGDNYTVKYIY
ncbi:MAG: transglutaminase domain-containing protein [Lachnospiraceae bacterium]|nr:transglutaminase domain-containing protein [Lachnospiraceae bacterium]